VAALRDLGDSRVRHGGARFASRAAYSGDVGVEWL